MTLNQNMVDETFLTTEEQKINHMEIIDNTDNNEENFTSHTPATVDIIDVSTEMTPTNQNLSILEIPELKLENTHESITSDENEIKSTHIQINSPKILETPTLFLSGKHTNTTTTTLLNISNNNENENILEIQQQQEQQKEEEEKQDFTNMNEIENLTENNLENIPPLPLAMDITTTNISINTKTNYEIYLNFLQTNNIKNFSELCDILCRPPYKLRLINVKQKHWKMFVLTSNSKLRMKNIKLFHQLVIDSTNDFYYPLFLNYFIESIKCTNAVEKLPLSLINHKLYAVNHMVLFKLFFFNNKWFIIQDYNYSCLHPIDKKNKNLFKIFQNACNEYNFDYVNLLNINYIYFFFITNKQLNHLNLSYKTQMSLYKIFDRSNKFQQINLENDLNTFNRFTPLKEIKISTKYQLHKLIKEKNLKKTHQYILEHNNKLFAVTTCLYNKLKDYNNHFYFSSIFFRYLNLKRHQHNLEEYLHFFPKDRNLFMKLEKRLKYMVEDIFEIYVHKYIEKNETNLNLSISSHVNLYEIVFDIFLLKVNITKMVVTNYLLYTIGTNNILNLLRNYK